MAFCKRSMRARIVNFILFRMIQSQTVQDIEPNLDQTKNVSLVWQLFHIRFEIVERVQCLFDICAISFIESSGVHVGMRFAEPFHFDLNASIGRLKRVAMQKHQVCFEVEEVLRSKSARMDWTRENNHGCVAFMGSVTSLVEMFDEQRKLLVLFTAVDAGVITFEANFECLRE